MSVFVAGAVLLSLAVATPGLAPASPPAGAAMATANKELLRAAFSRWAAGGSGFFDEVLAPDVAWTIEGSGPAAGTYRGKADFLDRAVAPFARLLATPVRPRVDAIWADGDDVVVQWRGTATTKRGRPYRNSYVWIFRMRDGRATAVTAFLDLPAYYAVFAEAGRAE